MSNIIDNLWLCSWEEVKKMTKLNTNCTLVVNCTVDLPSIIENTINIPINDDQSNASKLNKYIFNACSKIHTQLENNLPVICHCLAGVSRSASVIVCYLIIYHNMDKESAINFVRSKRPHALMFLNFEKTFDYISE